MPVLLVDRDPVLVSIDQQRLADLGIPSEVVHDNAAGLYGPCGIMWAALVVPEGWQDELPEDLPVQSEWDDEAWALAENDSSEERPEHARPVEMDDCVIAGLVSAFFVWCPFFVMAVTSIIHGQQRGSHRVSPQYVPNAIGAFSALLVIGVIGGLLTPGIGRRLRLEEGRLTFGWLVVALYFNLPGLLLGILFGHS